MLPPRKEISLTRDSNNPVIKNQLKSGNPEEAVGNSGAYCSIVYSTDSSSNILHSKQFENSKYLHL